MTPALLKSTKTKDKLFKKFQKFPTAENKLKYCKYKNVFTELRRRSEKEFFHHKFELARGNLKETWKIIKDVVNKKQNDFSIPDSFKYESRILQNPDEISNKFNEFFVSIGPKLDAKIDPAVVDFKTFLHKKYVADSFFISPTSPEEIVSILNACKNKYSSGWDNIPMAVIKAVGTSIAAPFSYICNLSFTTGIFPSDMKTAKVTPIYKADARDEFSNYRPISLLPNFSKIIEKLMYKRLIDFLNKNKVLYEQQYGFRQNFSTDFALIELPDKIAEAIHKKKFTIGIFVHLSKAFDTLNIYY